MTLEQFHLYAFLLLCGVAAALIAVLVEVLLRWGLFGFGEIDILELRDCIDFAPVGRLEAVQRSASELPPEHIPAEGLTQRQGVSSLTLPAPWARSRRRPF